MGLIDINVIVVLDTYSRMTLQVMRARYFLIMQHIQGVEVMDPVSMGVVWKTLKALYTVYVILTGMDLHAIFLVSSTALHLHSCLRYILGIH